jgi:hypothetical protein
VFDMVGDVFGVTIGGWMMVSAFIGTLTVHGLATWTVQKIFCPVSDSALMSVKVDEAVKNPVSRGS